SRICGYVSSAFTYYTYQVQMSFVTGDTCCGIVFSLEASFLTTYSEFFICTDGSYHLNDINVLSNSILQGFTTMNTGVGQTNVIAVVANGPTVDLYINGQKINATQGRVRLGLVLMGCLPMVWLRSLLMML